MMADIYVICVQGHLDSAWSNGLGEMNISLCDNGTTKLTGELVDQAALIGCLIRLNNLGAKLLLIENRSSQQLV